MRFRRDANSSVLPGGGAPSFAGCAFASSSCFDFFSPPFLHSRGRRCLFSARQRVQAHAGARCHVSNPPAQPRARSYTMSETKSQKHLAVNRERNWPWVPPPGCSVYSPHTCCGHDTVSEFTYRLVLVIAGRAGYTVKSAPLLWMYSCDSYHVFLLVVFKIHLRGIWLSVYKFYSNKISGLRMRSVT